MSELTDEQKRVAEQVAPNDLVSRRRDETTDARFTMTHDKQGQPGKDSTATGPNGPAHQAIEGVDPQRTSPEASASSNRDKLTDARFTLTPDKQGQSNGDGRTEEPEVGAHSILVPPDIGRSGRGAGLEQHETKEHETIKMGHLMKEHIDKSDSDLMKRFEGPKKYQPSEFSSAFTDRATAEAVAAKTIADPDNQAKLQKWTENGQQGNLPLMYNGNPETPIGRGIRQDGTVVPMHDARVVLKSEGNGNWFILTGYPEKR